MPNEVMAPLVHAAVDAQGNYYVAGEYNGTGAPASPGSGILRLHCIQYSMGAHALRLAVVNW